MPTDGGRSRGFCQPNSPKAAHTFIFLWMRRPSKAKCYKNQRVFTVFLVLSIFKRGTPVVLFYVLESWAGVLKQTVFPNDVPRELAHFHGKLEFFWPNHKVNKSWDMPGDFLRSSSWKLGWLSPSSAKCCSSCLILKRWWLWKFQVGFCPTQLRVVCWASKAFPNYARLNVNFQCHFRNFFFNGK